MLVVVYHTHNAATFSQVQTLTVYEHTHTHTQRGFYAGVGDALTLSVCVHVCVCVRERASRGVRPKLRSLLGERGPVWIRYRSDDGEVKGLWVF